RAAHVPLDNIVQDWFWWVHQGDPEFRADAYPDVPATLEKLHDEHVHAMISVWATFDPLSKNYQKMKALGYMVPGLRRMTRRIPRREIFTGTTWWASCLRRDGTGSGWIARSRRLRTSMAARAMPSFITSSSRLGMARCTRMCFR